MTQAATTATAYTPRIAFDRLAQIKTAVLAVAFLGAFWTLLDFVPPHYGSIVHVWLHDEDWSHGPLIPLFSIYLTYLRWEQVRRCALRYTGVGLVLLLAGLALYQYTVWGVRIGYARALAMMICLAGVIIYLHGLPAMRHLWLPWAYLLFAIPLPKGVYFALTDPLRRVAAVVATAVLQLVPGLDIQRVGSVIEYYHDGHWGQLGVADACSGMRSTITLCALGFAVAFASERAWWQRLVMLLACVPIAVFSNFIRVTTTCVLHIFVSPEYAQGTWHTVLGLVTLMLAFGIFSGLGWLLNNIVVEDEPQEGRSGQPA